MLIFDGAMGTQLQEAGLKVGGIPEELNIDDPDLIVSIHEKYLKAGADFITTNTFGCNRLKMAHSKYDMKDMLRAACDNADRARRNLGRENDSYIALDIGPIGTMLKPIGTLSFDEAVDIIAEQIETVKDKVDVVLLETQTDLYEVKAGILAAREHSDLPIFVTMTFEASGRSMTGTDAETFVNVAENLGVSALGVNCSLGPDELAPIIEDILCNSHIPVLIQPNAGIPKFVNGETVYELTADDFVKSVMGFAEKGVSICGGCCGTSPEFIRKLKENLPADVKPSEASKREYMPKVSSATKTVRFDGSVIVCGERLNPTGKKKLQAALRESNFDMLVSEALNQEEAGANVLDLNVGLPGIDEAETMKIVVPMIQEVTGLPLQLDSSSAEALETACRYYNGRPLINSVNGKSAVLDAILPVVKKYGGMVIGLTLEEGVPLTAPERVEHAKKIIARAESYGIRKEDVIIDCLTLTASAQQKEVAETLKAVSEVRKMGNHTVLGVSNVSFGLPNRPLINRTFLTMAMNAGLDMPIMNPLDNGMMSCIDAFNLLMYKDVAGEKYIERHAGDVTTTAPAGNAGQAAGAQASNAGGANAGAGDTNDLGYMIRKGMKDVVKAKTKEELASKDAMDVINNTIIPALNAVGQDYEKGRIFLPQLIAAAETTKLAFEVVQESFTGSGEKRGPVLIATVEGDVHDIGKNIVKVVCESYGYQMIDLGKDVKVSAVVEAAHKYNPKAIGLSALMTTTVVNMKKTIEALHADGITCPVFVGGAVLTQEIADEIGADRYSSDAMDAVHTLQDLGI